MTGLEMAPLLAIVMLGAVHGVNPAMGWLFAVGLGLQEKKGRAVWRALPPLALGHALSVLAVIAVAMLAGRVLPIDFMRWALAAVLLTFGLHRLLRGHRHPRYGGMCMTQRELVVWSFLMATAHGAGLMVLPFVLGTSDASAAAAASTAVTGHLAHAGHASGVGTVEAVAVFTHSISYLLVTTMVAAVVYRYAGLKMLRTAWINLDVVWAGVLIATALITPFW